LELDEHEIVELLRNGLELPSAPQAKGSTATHVADFVETLRGLEDPNAGAQTVLAKVVAWRTRVST
jgi:hypothetical protein